MYHAEQKHNYYDDNQQKEKYIENNDTINDTFVYINPSSLTSSREQPSTKNILIAKQFSRQNASMLLLLFTLFQYSREHSRGRYFSNQNLLLGILT
jgi:hypothetical protein